MHTYIHKTVVVVIMLIFTLAVKLNSLAEVKMSLDGCVKCFESNYITFQKSVKSVEKNV